MFPVAPDGGEVMTAERESGVGQQLLHPRVSQLRPFEVEEDELGLHPGAALLHPLHEGARGRVGGVPREAQPGVGLGLPQHLAQLSQGGHEPGQAGRVQLAHLAPVNRQLRGPAVGLVQQPVHGAVALPTRWLRSHVTAATSSVTVIPSAY